MHLILIYLCVDFPTLTDYCDATRAYFNPTFPELLDARKMLVERLTEMYNRNAIPMLPHTADQNEADLDHVYLS